MYNLFLDDIRQPKPFWLKHLNKELWSFYDEREWVIAKDYDDFVQEITERGLPELVSFDHDLADEHYNPKTWTQSFTYKEKTGADCAQFLIDYCMDNNLTLPQYLVHSQNPTGAENIRGKLDRFRIYQQTGK